MKVWESDGALSLMELLKADPDVAAALTAQQIEEKFNLDYHFTHVDTIFDRVIGEHRSRLAFATSKTGMQVQIRICSVSGRRSEERRVATEWVGTCRFRRYPHHDTQKY